MHMLMCKYLKNNSLITCILWNQGYFGHFDYVMCFLCRGVPSGPHTYPWWSFSGDKLARRKARWQALRFTSGSECAGAGGQSWHQDAISHPEVDLYPEVNLLALADKELHPGVDFHPVDSHPEVNVLTLAVWSLASGSQTPSVSECKSQTAQMFRNVSHFSEVFCAELI